MAESNAVRLLPFAVRNWLIQHFLADPTPATWQPTDESPPQRIVFVRYADFAGFLTGAGFDLLSSLTEWRAAGWIEDYYVVVSPSADPGESLPHHLERLNLPIGRHRLVGILEAVVKTPCEPREQNGAPAPPRAADGTDGTLPEWIITCFRSKQYKLLKALWGKRDASEAELVKLLEYHKSPNPEGNLKRRITETNKNLCDRSDEIGEVWTIRERTREGVKSYFLTRQK